MSVLMWVALGLTGGTIGIEPNERIVLVGDAFVEREGDHGFLETELLCRYPKVPIKMRNLGWSGDTPAGLSRAYFDPPAKGFERLVEQIAACNPTMVVVGYGMADAVSGTSPVAFDESLNRLLDRLPESTRRVALVSPIARARAVQDVSDSPDHPVDQRLSQYTEVIKDIASRRGASFVDAHRILASVDSASPPLHAANGMHLNERGYSLLSGSFWSDSVTGDQSQELSTENSHEDAMARLRVGSNLAEMEDGALVWNGERYRSKGSDDRVEFRLSATRLPSYSQAPPHVEWKGMEAGTWQIEIDGVDFGDPVSKGAEGEIDLLWKPWIDQREELRALVRKKNSLYFQRYRPQNITYLLGFRAYEQGQNAREIEALDPKIQEIEERIDALRVPKEVKFTLIRSRAGSQAE